MVIDGKIMLFIGESFIETDEEYAQECMNFHIILTIVIIIIMINIFNDNTHLLDCEKKRKHLEEKITGLESEEKFIGTFIININITNINIKFIII